MPPTCCRWIIATSSNMPAAARCCRSTAMSRRALNLQRFQQGRGRQRQGRRQDLRRQPRPQLHVARLRQGADPESRPEGAELGDDVEGDRRPRRRDHQGRQARRLYRHPGRRPRGAGASKSGSRQRGKSLYTQEGKLGYDDKDIGEWFAFWDDLRKRGGCAAPDVQALDRGEIDSSLLSLGKAAMVVRPFQPAGRLPGDQQEQARPVHLSGRRRRREARPISEAGHDVERLGAIETAGGGGQAGQLLRRRYRSRQALSVSNAACRPPPRCARRWRRRSTSSAAPWPTTSP